MLTLAISCLTTSNLPWFVNLTFQVPMQYCSLQHRTLLPWPVPSTTGCCFCFGSVSFFFLEVFLHWSLAAYWAPTDLESSSLSVPSFRLFIVFVGFSRHQYWRGLPFPSPVDHILSDAPPWPVCHGWPHTAWLSFIELDKAVVHVVRMVSFLWLWFQSVCPLMPSLSVYHLTWASFTLYMGYLFTAALAKRSCCSLPCTWGISSCLLLLTLDGKVRLNKFIWVGSNPIDRCPLIRGNLDTGRHQMCKCTEGPPPEEAVRGQPSASPGERPGIDPSLMALRGKQPCKHLSLLASRNVSK